MTTLKTFVVISLLFGAWIRSHASTGESRCQTEVAAHGKFAFKLVYGPYADKVAELKITFQGSNFIIDGSDGNPLLYASSGRIGSANLLYFDSANLHVNLSSKAEEQYLFLEVSPVEVYLIGNTPRAIRFLHFGNTNFLPLLPRAK